MLTLPGLISAPQHNTQNTQAIKGAAGPQNKYPGSELDLAWNSTTTYGKSDQTVVLRVRCGLHRRAHPITLNRFSSTPRVTEFAGATYTTDTQYGLSGSEYTSGK